jgi:hypothetical protein
LADTLSKTESARAKASALYSVEDLKTAIRAGDKPELRLKLKAEIRKRVASINFSFDSVTLGGTFHGHRDPTAEIRFVNGNRRFIILHGEIAELIWMKS